MSTAGDSVENCSLGEECGTHYRISSRYEEEWFFNFTDYLGEYLIITSAIPEVSIYGADFLSMLGIKPYDTAILKVGDMTLHEKAIDAHAKGEPDSTWIAWTQRYEKIEDAKLGHDMVVAAYKDDLLTLDV